MDPKEFDKKRDKDGRKALWILYRIFVNNPHLRVGQIIENALDYVETRSRGTMPWNSFNGILFYIENDKLCQALLKFEKSLKKSS